MDRMDRMDHLDRHPDNQSVTASGAVALYAGAAVAFAVVLALAVGMPDWAVALITAVLLGVVAHVLRGAAHPHGSRSAHRHAVGHRRVGGGTPPIAPPSGLGMPYPPMPYAAPGSMPGTTAPAAPRQDHINPESRPHGV